MSCSVIRLTAVALVLATILGAQTAPQTAERHFRFTPVASDRSVQEIATVIRSITDLSVTADAAGGSLSVRGSSGRVALAEWLFAELDRPVDRVTKREYRIADSDEIARIFYLNATAPQEVHEIAVIARSLPEISRVFVYNPARALILRGPAERIAMADWLIQELDKPQQPSPSTKGNEYRMAGAVDEGARVFHLPPTASPQQLQEVSTILRSTADIRRVFTYTRTKAVALRGTATEMAMADWLFQELLSPSGRKYSFPRSTDDFTRILQLSPATTPSELQEAAVSIRSTSGIPRIFTYYPQRAMIVRGTSHQVATAERLVQEKR
jgi:type II secretory pathway component GspD/PulD (secretin)